MGFKLQRVDVNGVNDTCQIQLEEGKHLIGRGKFLHCEDKRVSRSHGELEVTENSVNLKALHTNPCFYTRKDTLTREMLKQNDSIDLRNGDRFGLLPVNCWYKVLYTTDDVEDQTSVKKETQLENGQSETNRTVFFDSTQVDNGFTDRMDTAPQPTNDNVSNPPPPNDNEQPPSPNDSNVSQSLMQDLPEALQCINDLTENEKSPRNPTDTDLPVRIKTEQVDLDPVPLSPLKRPFPSTSEVKLEPEQNVKKIKAENDDDKFSDDVKAGSSNSSNGPDAAKQYARSRVHSTESRKTCLMDEVLDKINAFGQATSMDRWDHAAKAWAAALRELPRPQQILADKLINDILFEAQFHSLTRQSRINVGSPAVTIALTNFCNK